MKQRDYFMELLCLMRKYDKDMVTKRNISFLKAFYDKDVRICIPLSERETYILRSLTKVLPEKTDFQLAKEYGVSVLTIRKWIKVIESTLRIYFYDVHRLVPKYNSSINESNELKTIFEFDISFNGICTLRMFKCYYLKDVTCMDKDGLMGFLSKKDQDKLLKALSDNNMICDWKEKKLKKSRCKITKLK